ncbi:MAG: hypothetical protein JWL96_2336 [Sphingomonas bacterium]|uniref:hypothetical protein n=1 Tax=Sphingomonas bacterium TaxID=1895847 RepID=UPI00261AF301|nr:hypothetical protein [Sphingomonas bacterium]MDB5710266.1 hypothetical protein [Sphingomonas bacterium]
MTIVRSIGAVLAGVVTVVVLSNGTDYVLEHSVLPAMATPAASPGLLALALVYRVIYGAIGGYVTARLAPGQPMTHAVILGAIGTLLGVLGIFAMWSFGNHWYPIALAVLAIPQSWAGARLAGAR